MQKHLFCLLLLIGLALPSFSKQIEDFTLNKPDQKTLEFVFENTRVVLNDMETTEEGSRFPQYHIYEDSELNKIYILEEWRSWTSLYIFKNNNGATILLSNPDLDIRKIADKLSVPAQSIFQEKEELQRLRMDIAKIENGKLSFSFMLQGNKDNYEMDCVVTINEQGLPADIESVSFSKYD